MTTAAVRGATRQSSHSTRSRKLATVVATGATRDGERLAIAREKPITASTEARDETTITGGSADAGKFERKSASRAALAATCWVIRRKAARVAARTTGRVSSSRTASPIVTSSEGPSGPLLAGPDLLRAGQEILEPGIVADRIPHRIDLQLLNGNVVASRKGEDSLQGFHRCT